MRIKMFNFKKIKKISFSPATKNAKFLYNIPKPSIRSIPDWYKKQKLFSNEQNDILVSRKNNSLGTYKLCLPFIDSLTSGYMIKLEADILVKNMSTDNSYAPHIEWDVTEPMLDFQNSAVIGNYPVPIGYSKNLFRWYHDWIIKTPKNYSIWITHPSHRHDLPFFTINGFVDTDKFQSHLLMPFFIKDGFEGIIEKGTPIAQIIPIKRNIWLSVKKRYKEKNAYIILNNVRSKILRGYKKMYWSKKEYT
jgi:hypothetical protein